MQISRCNKIWIWSIFSALCVVSISAKCSAAEPLTYSEVIKKTRQVVDKGMEVYTGPPKEPQPEGETRSPQVLAWYEEYRKTHVAVLTEMDNAVAGMIENGFERGLSLSSIQERTSICVAWVEWPERYSNLGGEPRGISDRWLADEEWVKPSNDVVVIHQARRMPGGVEFHFLQNTFRSRFGKDPGFRINISAYVLIVENGGVRHEQLYWSMKTSTLDSSTRKLLGFVDRPGGGFPDILMYTGPFASGSWIRPVYYIWFDKMQTWEEFSSSEGTLRPAGTVTFDPDTAKLRYGFGGESRGAVMDMKEALGVVRHYMEKRREEGAEDY